MLLPVLVNGQKDEGVKFERNITIEKWNSIFERAKKEEKYVFVYINYIETEKQSQMVKDYELKIQNTFAESQVGNFFNKKFVNLYIQPKYKKNVMDSKSLYDLFRETYKIYGTPVGLVFDNTGKILNKFNILAEPDWMLNKASKSLEKDGQYYTLLEEYNSGNRSVNFLKKFFILVNEVHDIVDTYLKEFIHISDNLFTKENGEFLMSCRSEKIAFDYLYANQDIWKKLLDNNKLASFYENSIYRQISTENAYFIGDNKVDKDNIINLYSKKYPEYGKTASKIYLYRYYEHKKDTVNFINLLKEVFNNNDTIYSPIHLNSFAWSVFENMADTSLLNKALAWSKQSLEQSRDEPAYLDTYANLLYKLGQTKEAIEIETKALELVKESEKKSYQETLDKMKAGKPTWKL
jgi:hypothetical protein